MGESLIRSAAHVVNKEPERVAHIGVGLDDDPAAITRRAQQAVAELDDGDGVLVLSDIYGATPCNIAMKLMVPGRIEGVAGVSLPMLIRALTYRDRGMRAIVTKAVSGGRDGVVNINRDICRAVNTG
jgi:PTS system ascorbate-specific IIA component